MRSIWKGSISFGLVSIPVKVVSATESHSVSFHQVHTTDGGRIRYRKVCELEEREVPREEIGKGFETGDGTTVQLTDADLAALPLPTAKTVEILGFVPAEEVDPIQLDRSYYLAGDGRSAAKPYALLREALKRSGKVAVGKLAMRGRESLGLLRVYENVLALHTMLWPEEIRAASAVAPEEDVAIRDAELDLADTLMETLGDLDWSELHDEYRAAVEQLVTAKLEGVDTGAAGEEAAAAGKGEVVDLMSVLESSVQAARRSRGEGAAGSEDATVHELSRQRGAKGGGGTGGRTSGGTAKKPSAKKTAKTAKAAKTAPKKAASKTEAKRAPAKKTAGKAVAKKAAPAGKTSGAKTAATKAAQVTKASGTKKAASKTAAKRAPAKKTTAKKTARTRKSA
ncbi:Ku protein [Streptomyces sp. Amel2xB2]|uniref:non-homologous end joining protein Ku n=1 Tax=Streptomyces sp. Amel2xB2 TaxID=1305829 RepID=UPI000DBA1D4B|nr:Ku protein [Streptomyces sp. Amel2xB2]RAJ70148.1 Ku protein [Streptomyces sp. Amel2xB2]